ncbi:MAG: hypothetical protein U7127_05075 [Phormidium sp.]
MLKEKILITATYSRELIEESLSYWLQEMGLSYPIEFAPYNQVFQELLNPASLLATNQKGVNVVLVRFEDWQGTEKRLQLRVDDALKAQIIGDRLRDKHNLLSQQLGQKIAQIEQILKDFGSALKTARMRSTNPFLVCICPPSPTTDTELKMLQERIEELLAEDLKNVSGIYLIKSQELTSIYPVKEYYDPCVI